MTTKQAQSLINKLNDIFGDAGESVEYREDYHLEKSERWQDSEKGEEYQDKTYLLEEYKDSIEEAITKLEEFIE